MTSTITLYRLCELTPERNFAVDNVEEYLATLYSQEYADQNYFKPALNTSLKLTLTQDALEFDLVIYNYCKIVNEYYQIGDRVPMYFFIVNKKWRSEHVVELELVMDTVATLGWLKLTNKTLVHREHRDRYNVLSSSVAIPVIDKISEGLNPILYKDNEKIASYEGTDNTIDTRNKKWYLVYYNSNAINPTDFNQSNPVNAEFFIEGGETAFYSFANNNSGGNLRTMLSGDDYLLIPYPLKDGRGNIAGSFTIVINNTEIDCAFNNNPENIAGGTGYRLTVSGSVIVGRYCKFTVDQYGNVSSLTYLGATTYSTNQFKLKKSAGIVYGYSVENDFYNDSYIVKTLTETVNSTLTTIDAVDRTDSRIIKIVEFPYCPIPIEVYDSYLGRFYFKKPVEEGGDYHGLKILYSHVYDKNITAEYSFSNVPAYPNDLAVLNPSTKNSNENRNVSYETKLFNSEIYNYKLVYDSFSNIIQLENIALTASLLAKEFTFDFVISKNFSSTFILDYSKSFPNSLNNDYNDILLVKRNNEVEIYTSQYINYLKTGYNYDVKAKEQRQTRDTAGIILGAIGGIAGVGLGFATGNPAVVAGSLISAGTAITSSIVNSVSNSISATQAIESKLAQAKAQAVSVSQCDELSLLEYYTKSNKAKLVTYKPSSNMKANLFNLFFYLGYKTELMKIPNLNSRLRFNFIQADLDIDLMSATNALRNIPNEVLDDYKARFAVGLTIFHKYKNSWNFEQDKENWETTFENYLN